MQYHTIQFIEFLIAVVVLYYTVCRRVQKYLLLGASLIFYALLGWDSLALMAGAALLSWGLGLAVGKSSRPGDRKALAALSVLLQLGILVLIKGWGVLTRVTDRLFPLLGFEFLLPGTPVVAAVGVSFYMMQTIAYTVDVYRGTTPPEKNILNYMLFVGFFPHVLQGPIPRKEQLLPQLTQPHPFSYNNLKFGTQLLFWGLFKKLVVADRLSSVVAKAYTQPNHFTGALTALAVVFYAIQLYCDFSGCVDIARGASQMLGVDLAPNFRQPYLARSIPDFWRRWHISLSSWLRDYVYIPLGGSRKGKARKYLNVALTFVVSALWHGAGWTFLLWGGLHALYQIAGMITRPWKIRLRSRLRIAEEGWLNRLCQTLVTFLLVCFAWLFFRAESLSQAGELLTRILTDFSPSSLWDWRLRELCGGGKNLLVLGAGIVFVLGVELAQHRKAELRLWLDQKPYLVQCAVNIAVLMAVVIFGAYGAEMEAVPFLYFQF